MPRADRHRGDWRRVDLHGDPDGPLLTWRDVVTTLFIAAAATAAAWAVALLLAGP